MISHSRPCANLVGHLHANQLTRVSARNLLKQGERLPSCSQVVTQMPSSLSLSPSGLPFQIQRDAVGDIRIFNEHPKHAPTVQADGGLGQAERKIVFVWSGVRAGGAHSPLCFPCDNRQGETSNPYG